MSDFHSAVPLAVALSVPTLATGCGGDPAADGHAVARDSAGIVLVDNTAPRDPASVPHWDADIDLVIGEEDGDEDYTFGHIADVAVDGRGRMLVLDQLAQHLVIYDSVGRFVARVGRSGDGPGEFSNGLMSVTVTSSDSIYVADYFRSLVHVFGPDGGHGRSITVPPWAVTDVAASDTAPLVAHAWHVTTDAAGVFRVWDGLLRIGRDGGVSDTLLEFEYPQQDLGGRVEIRLPVIRNAAFWDRLADGRIAWSSTDQTRVCIYGADGRLERVVSHTEWRARPIGDAERDVLVQLYRDATGNQSEPVPPNVDFPTTLPAITNLGAASDGGFWVQRMGDVAAVDRSVVFNQANNGWLGGPTWDVFDREGQWVGTVRVPDRFRITRITSGLVYGIQKDEVDVERVVRLRVRGP